MPEREFAGDQVGVAPEWPQRSQRAAANQKCYEWHDCAPLVDNWTGGLEYSQLIARGA